jgi:hypothetical protein
MTRHYAPKAFLRHVPIPLLRRFFERETIPIGLDWDAVTDGELDPIYDAWLALAPDPRERAEKMFRDVHELADPVAARMLAEETAYQGCDLSGLDPTYGYHAATLWVLLTYPVVFHQVARVRHAEHLPGRYWNRLMGLPSRDPDTSPAAVQRLKIAVADYFRSEQGRGHRVTVEHYLRGGVDHYFFCYPDDYTQTMVGHDRYGALKRLPRRPAFEVVFAFTPAAGVLELYAPGPKAVRQALADLFCKAVIDTLPPLEQPHRPPYELNALLDRSLVFPTEPEDGVREVRVRRLRVALPGSARRVVLDADPAGSRGDVFDFLDELLPADRFPRDRLNVTLATLSLTYRPAGADRERTLTFDVSYPDGCSLKSRPEDQRLLGEKYLRRWGVARD